MSTLVNGIYNTFFRRNSVFIATIFAGAFAFEMSFMRVTEIIYDNYNKGKQWKDIRHKYVNNKDDDDE